MSSIRRSLDLFWEKNGQEIQAILSGRMSRFFRTDNFEKEEKGVVVFVFHSVEPVRFEKQLRYLTKNEYTTVGSDSLLEISKERRGNSPRTVALTFDDATGSFWATAFPLLKKYGFRAILFAIPGLVPDDSQTYPNLEDVWAGRSPFEEIVHRERLQPLCTWSELIEMHQSGIVDVQSHSLTHSRINVSPRIVDFIHPEFDSFFYGNVNVPISRNDNAERPLRKMRLGAPVYESTSRLTGRRRLLEDPAVGERLVRYVQENGETAFFSRSTWRHELERTYRGLVKRAGIHIAYESSQETEAAIRLELTKSKEILENKLPGKNIKHFCYPWFQGSPLSERIAGECGYHSVFYGLENWHDNHEPNKLPVRIRRISEEYLFCIPGKGKKAIINVWAAKFYQFIFKARMDKKGLSNRHRAD